MFKFPIYSFLKSKAFPPLKVKNCLYRKGPELTSWSALNSILHSLRNVFFHGSFIKAFELWKATPRSSLCPPSSKVLLFRNSWECYPLNSSCTFIALPRYLPSLYPIPHLNYCKRYFWKHTWSCQLATFVVIFPLQSLSDKFWSIWTLSFHHSSLLNLAVGLSLDFWKGQSLG